MSDFTAEAELSLTVPDRQIQNARAQIEAGLEDIEVGVNAGRPGGARTDGGSGGREQRRRRREFRLARERTAHLEDMVEILEDADFGGGDGGGSLIDLGGLGKFAGAGVALGGAGIAGLGIGTGAGIAQAGGGAGDAAREIGSAVASQIGSGEDLLTFAPTLEPEFTPTFEPVFEPEFAPVFNPMFEPVFNATFEPQFDPEFNPVFEPVFEPSFTPTINPSITVNPSVSADLNASVNFSPSVRVAPSFNVEVTGLDLSGGGSGGLSREVERAIQDVEDSLESQIADLERQISSAVGNSRVR